MPPCTEQEKRYGLCKEVTATSPRQQERYGFPAAPTDRSLDRYILTPAPEQLNSLPPTPLDELGEDRNSFFEKSLTMGKRLGKGIVESVNVFEGDISLRERAARGATVASFFVPFGVTARVLGTGAKLASRVATTALQEAVIGGGIEAIRGGNVTAGAGVSGALGGAIEYGLGKYRLAKFAKAVKEWDDPALIRNLQKTPLHNQPYTIVSAQLPGLTPEENAKRVGKLIMYLQGKGFDARPLKGQLSGNPAEDALETVVRDDYAEGAGKLKAAKLQKDIEEFEFILRSGKVLPGMPLMPVDVQDMTAQLMKWQDELQQLDFSATSGKPITVYHGTSKAFDEFDFDKADPDALYGPGAYFTENPEVAGGTFKDGPGGYVNKGQDPSRFMPIHPTPEELEHWYKSNAPNVRPARLRMKNPFDMDKDYGVEGANELLKRILSKVKPAQKTVGEMQEYQILKQLFSDDVPGEAFSGEAVYRRLVDALHGDKVAAREALKAAGFDGITHIGGSRTGTDPHRVWIAWDNEQILPAWRAAKATEDAILVPGLSKAEAMTVAKRFNQGRFLTNEGLFDLENMNFRPVVKSGTKFNSAVTPDDEFVGQINAGNMDQLFSMHFGDAQKLGPDLPKDPVKRVLSLMAPTRGRLEELRDNAANVPWNYRLQQWYQNIVDSNTGFRTFEETVLGSQAGKTFTLPSKVAQLARGWASVAEHNLKYGMVSVDDASRMVREKGLLQLFEKVDPAEWEAFTAYGFARRWKAISRSMGKKLPKLDDGTRMTIEELDGIIANAPKHFASVFDEIVDWRNRFLQEYLGNTGIISEKGIKAILTSPDYVPLRLSLDELVSRVDIDTPGKDFFGVFDPVKRLQGLRGKYENWAEMLVKETMVFTQLAHHQKVLSSVINLAENSVPELRSNFLKKVKLKPRKLAKSKQEVIASLKDSDPAMAEAVQNLDEEILALLDPKSFLGDKKYIGGLVDGARVWYEVKDPLLWEAIDAMGPAEKGFWGRVLSNPIAEKPASWLRAGATLSFEFIARNPLRDLPFAAVTAGANPVNFLKGIASALKQDEWFKQWTAAGGPRAALVSLDRKVLRDEMVKAVKEGTRARHVIKYPLDALQALSEFMETGTRLGHFRAQYPKLLNEGWKPADAIQEAALRSRNVSVDFGVHGAKTSTLRNSVAFWNAMIQGYRQTAQSLIRDPMAKYRALGFITVPSVALYFHNRKDPEYFDLPNWERTIFWHVKAGDKWLRIPKPFELGLVFGTMVEKMLQAIDQQDPAVLDAASADFFKDNFRNLMPVPTTLRPFIEKALNKDFFTGRPVIPRGQENIEGEFRETSQTSDVVKGISRMLNLHEVGLDPITLEHFFEAYTGGLGRMSADIADATMATVTGNANPRPGHTQLGPLSIPPAHKWPAVKGFVSNFPETNESTERFYRFAEETEKAAGTASKLEKELRLDDLEDYIEQKFGLIAAAPDTRKIIAELRSLREQRQLIRNSPSMNSAQKQEMIDMLLEMEYSMVRSAGELERLVQEIGIR